MLIMLPVSAVAVHMIIHSPISQLGLDAAVYIALPGGLLPEILAGTLI